MFNQILHNFESILNLYPVLALGVCFIAGIVSSLSPCIYPLIPITLGVVGIAHSTSQAKGFYISAIFVLGICFAYTVLGVIASLFGVMLGIFFINPITYLVLAGVFFLFGFSALEVFKLKLPGLSFQYTPTKSMVSLFVLGIISALGLIPCNFPVLGSILSLISLKGSIGYGIVALLFFSLGQGMLLLVLGTFSSLIRKLPKTGKWLIIVRSILGGILIIVGGYFLVKFIHLIKP